VLQKIFPKAIQNESDARPTPLEIAAAVRRPGKHQLAEHKLAALRERHEFTRQKMREARQGIGQNFYSEEKRDRAVTAVALELDALEADIRGTRLELAPLRVEHGERVEQALRPMRRAAGRKIEEALTMLEAAVSELDRLNDACRRHAYDAPPVRMPDVEAVRGAIRRIA